MNIGVSVKMIVCVILLHVIMSAIKVCKIQEYLDIKNCSGKERLILN